MFSRTPHGGWQHSRFVSRGLRCGIVAPAIFTALLAICTTPLAAQHSTVIRLPESGDAWLQDVVFVDADEGWAVGREGVIWHTANGGQNWELQHAEPGIILHCVRFIDELHGWAVGGKLQPLSWRSSAVILRTSSGGRRWTRVESAGIPELTHVKFFDANRGVAVGFASTLYPTGVVRTDDGGRSWMGLGGAAGGPWITALWKNADDGVLLSRDGVAVVRRGQVMATNAPGPDAPPGRALLPAPRGGGYWVAGDAGLLRGRADGEANWNRLESHLPEPFRAMTLTAAGDLARKLAPDFHAAATHREHIWLAGAPGSFVLHSPDGGRTWERQLTQQPLPIEALYFLDAEHGWAVGALGTIMATRNGGRTWHIQQQGGERLALWGIHPSQRSLPLPLLGYLAGQEGWLVGATVLSPVRAARETASGNIHDRRTVAALSSVRVAAAATSSRFPIASVGGQFDMRTTMAAWQRVFGAKAEQEWMDYLHWQLAQWRPDVVALGRYDTAATTGVDRFIHRTLLQWAQTQNQPGEFPARLRAWGLEPWRPQKLVEWTPSRQRAQRSMPVTQLIPLAYTSVDVYAWPSLLYLSRSPQAFPDRLGWRTVWRAVRSANRDHLIESNSDRGIGAIRRKPSQVALNLQRINEIAQALKEMHAYCETPDDLLSRADWPARVQRLWQRLPPPQAGQAMFRLALAAADNGKWDAAHKLVRAFAAQYPTHSLHESAVWWLLRHEGSHEITSAQRQAHSQVTQASATAPDSNGPAPLDAWSALTNRHPELLTDPLVALPHAARIGLKEGREAARLWSGVSTIAWPEWSGIAKSELWLGEPRGALIVPAVRAPLVTKPVLDGELTELFWERAARVELSPEVTTAQPRDEPATSVRVAYDREYLYIAAECDKPRSERDRQVAARTSRDSASANVDHLYWEIDVDRDYSTAFEFMVDCRSFVSDSCVGSLAWNPTWYVAVSESSRKWTIECAIPWSELGTRPARPDSPMAIRFRRRVPGVAELRWPEALSTRWGWLMGEAPSTLPTK